MPITSTTTFTVPATDLPNMQQKSFGQLNKAPNPNPEEFKVISFCGADFSSYLICSGLGTHSIHINTEKTKTADLIHRINVHSNFPGQPINGVFKYVYYDGEKPNLLEIAIEIGESIVHPATYQVHKELIDKEIIKILMSHFEEYMATEAA